MIVTTRVAPEGLALRQPQRQRALRLDEGLQSPYAEETLRALDSDGTVGLKTAADALLDQVRQRTRGFPRALEAFYGTLAADPGTSLDELLAGPEEELPDNVVHHLVGEAYCRLDRTAQAVMQALAIYARPVPPVAVDFLLQPHEPAIDSASVLSRLLHMHFVRKESGRYYLHPVDLAYALAQVTEGSPEDQHQQLQPLTQYGMRHRAAEYFHQTRRPRTEWKTLADLEPQLAEFELRCAARDYDTAARLLNEVDFNYLNLWGHARLIASNRELLVGHICDRRAEAVNLGNLGTAHLDLGHVQQAIAYYEQALAIAHEIGDRRGEAVRTGNLGLAYSSLGQMGKAIEHYEQALAIATRYWRSAWPGSQHGQSWSCIFIPWTSDERD